MIPYGHQTIEEDDIQAVTEVLRSDWLTQGPKVAEFEQALADCTGAKFAVAVSNGTAALQAAYFAAGIQPGDEVITSPLTFAATSNAALWLGAKIVFADVDPETGNLDPTAVESVVTEKTKAIVPVDYAGHPADMSRLREIASRCGAKLIEDSAHALGASIGDRKVGTLADLTTMSFHPVKIITTGEGGAILTDNPDFAERLRLYRSHGITKANLRMPSPGDWYYEQQELGQNYRLTDFQSALGISQLKKLDRFLAARHEVAGRYAEALKDVKTLRLPVEREGFRSGWHLYPIRLIGAAITKRPEVFRQLREAGIGVQVHYIPVYWHPYYQTLGYRKGLCPNVESFYETEISIPMFPALSTADQQSVIDILKKILVQYE
ncbi:MAG: UDP-4-amino-4,6-dideoxy-N-acetyl-beta-L-altrosamine transaminase [Patescibacteria group bacterium]